MSAFFDLGNNKYGLKKKDWIFYSIQVLKMYQKEFV
mgnify:CR=1 FL=1